MPPARSSTEQMENTPRSEEHTSELQSPCNLVCRLLLEIKHNLAQHGFGELFAPMRVAGEAECSCGQQRQGDGRRAARLAVGQQQLLGQEQRVLVSRVQI